MLRLTMLALFALAPSGCAFGTGTNPRDYDGGIAVDAGRDAGSSTDAGAPLDTGAALDAGTDAGVVDAGIDAGGAPEVCDGVDQDADGVIDEDDVCPCPVRTFAGHAYQFCGTAQPWAMARASCEANGYSLVVVESPAEDAFVYGEISARGMGTSWIGLNDRMTEGVWVWLDGVPVVYEHWDAGEPNDGGGGEDCGVIMTTSGRETEWDDRGCGDDRDYVCEAPPP